MDEFGGGLMMVLGGIVEGSEGEEKNRIRGYRIDASDKKSRKSKHELDDVWKDRPCWVIIYTEAFFS